MINLTRYSLGLEDKNEVPQAENSQVKESKETFCKMAGGLRFAWHFDCFQKTFMWEIIFHELSRKAEGGDEMFESCYVCI